MGRVLGRVTIKFLGPLFISGIAADADFKIGTYRYIDVLNGSAFLSVAHRRSLFYVLQCGLLFGAICLETVIK